VSSLCNIQDEQYQQQENNHMKKLLLGLFGVAMVAGSVLGSSLNFTAAPNATTSLLTGSAKVSQFILTSGATNANTLSFFDTAGTNTVYTNASYVTVQTVQMQITNTYTNWFGVVTNQPPYPAIVDTLVTNAPSTNSFPLRLTAYVPTNGTITISGVNYYFTSGVLVTNVTTAGTGGTANITLTFSQP
jgi:hypothetical protein